MVAALFYGHRLGGYPNNFTDLFGEFRDPAYVLLSAGKERARETANIKSIIY
jgi:hypothetical protein